MIRIWLPCLLLSAWSVVSADEPLMLRRQQVELFVDDQLIASLSGDVSQQLQQPRPEEVVLVTDKPWEGNTSAYYTLFQDGDLYRMYYRGSHVDELTRSSQHAEVTCYAESSDGIHWTKPELGLFDWNGSSANNIVWQGIGTHNFAPFKDRNPEAPVEARYKAIASNTVTNDGLYVFQSPDGIHWSLMSDQPIITDGTFDSQNLAFWDESRRCYVEYHRTFVDGVRSIMTCTSDDFIHWTKPELLTYPAGTPAEHLYTNAILPYDRARGLRIGFPTRFQPAHEQVEPIFMSSRDGRHFRRWADPVIPITAPSERDGNRSNYMAHGLLRLPQQRHELAVYASESYYDGTDSRLRRFTYRVDGFVALTAGNEGGELLTKPFRFEGDQLILNYATQDAGELRVELQSADGETLEPFQLDACHALHGDEIDRVVSWKLGDGLIRFSDRPVRLRIAMRNAQLYSLHFRLLE